MSTAADIPTPTDSIRRSGLVLFAAVALATVLAGCAQTSSGRWAQTAPTVPQVEVDPADRANAAKVVASSGGGATRNPAAQTAAP